MKARLLLLPVAGSLSLLMVSCTSPPQHPTRVSPVKHRPVETHEDQNLVLLAQGVEARRSTVQLGYWQGWTP